MFYDIDYSVVIRTLGTAGEKYQKLLSCIEKLEPKPKEVIVVLPEGYEKPADQLGWEKFYFSPKGMVIQRSYGINAATTKYALVCDDDVCFDSDFVQKLYKPVNDGLCSFSAGPLLSFLPPKGSKTIISSVMGAAAPTLFHKNRYVSILNTGGYSFNRNINTAEEHYYEAQSLPWTCFFADVEAYKALKLDEELWLDMNGYSAFDDQTMFYKGWLKGYKTIVVSNALYEHLDAKTSTRKNKPATLYSSVFNRYVFWHRFIYTRKHNPLIKFWALSCFKYRIMWCKIWDLLDYLRHRYSVEDRKIIKQSHKDAKKFVKSSVYLSLPTI